MKKINILLLGLIGLMASSCEETIEPALPQENPQEPVLEAGSVVSEKSGVLASTAVIALEDYRADGTVIPVMKLDDAKDLPAGAQVSYKLQISNTDDFERNVILDAAPGETDDTKNIYYVSASEWNEAHIYLFGKSPKEKTAYYRVPVYVDVNGTDYRFDSTSYYAATGTLTETCMDQGFVIEDHYYLLGNASSWNLTDKAILADYSFAHSADVSVYDDPVFTLNFNVTQAVLDANGGGCYWKIAPQSSIDGNTWDGVVGPATNGDTSLKGTLVSKDPQAGMINEAGKYKMTINMETMAYTIEKVLQPEYLYTPGGANGWNQDNSSWMQLCVKKDGDVVKDQFYYCLSPVNNDGFKVCAEKNWDNATTYGAKTDTPADSGDFLVGQEGKNIKPAAAGLYWIRVNYETKGYTLTDYVLTPVTTVGMIGSFAASGWGTDVAMTSADDGITWTADVTFAANDEFKFRFNGNWDYNLGGDTKGLKIDGDNIKVETAGTYTVTLSLSGVPHATLTKK